MEQREEAQTAPVMPDPGSWLAYDLVPDSRLNDERDVRMLNPMVLAYVGDTVFDLYVRTCLVCRHDATTNHLNKLAVARVRAEGQRESLKRVEGILTEDESEILRRGRNAKSVTGPKHASQSDYRAATGLEALIGYLYLTRRWDRLNQMLKIAVNPEDI